MGLVGIVGERSAGMGALGVRPKPPTSFVVGSKGHAVITSNTKHPVLRVREENHPLESGIPVLERSSELTGRSLLATVSLTDSC